MDHIHEQEAGLAAYLTQQISQDADPSSKASELVRSLTAEKAEMEQDFSALFERIDTDSSGYVEKEEARI